MEINTKIEYPSITLMKISDDKKTITKILNKLNNEKIDEVHLKKEYFIGSNFHIKNMRKALFIENNNTELKITFEYIDGITLHEYMKKNIISVYEKINIIKNLLLIINSFHENNFIHLNLNPKNIIIDRYNEITIIDTGNSCQIDHIDEEIFKFSLYESMYVAPETTRTLKENIDISSDIYSIGIILYELFYDKQPFYGTTIDEIIHKHIAKEIVLETSKNIPEIINKLIQKMTEKNSKNRYKTAGGVFNDITDIISLEFKDDIILGKKDYTIKKFSPKQIYGRKKEYMEIYKNYLNRMERDDTITVLSGETGTGKTVLVKKLKKAIRKNSIFIEVKYQESYEGKPYYGIINGFNDFYEKLLNFPKNERENLINLLREIYKKTNGMLINFIPAIKELVSDLEVQYNEELNLNEDYYNLIFEFILTELSKTKYDIIYFIDDIHWADRESLNLIAKVLIEKNIERVFFICTQRTDTNFFYKKFIDDMVEKHSDKINQIELKNLTFETINYMLKEEYKATNYNDNDMDKLIKYVYEKTQGNPLFIIRLLQFIHNEKILTYDNINNQINISFEKLERLDFTENLINLLTNEIKNFDDITKNVIEIASCFGENFTELEISKISKLNSKKTHAILTGLKNKKYIYLKNNSYNFTHDKIKEAVQKMLSEENRRKIYFDIVEKIYKKDLKKYIVEAAICYNKIIDSIKHTNKLKEIAVINYNAAKETSKLFLHHKAFKFIMESKKIVESIDKNIKIEKSFIIDLYVLLIKSSYYSGEIELIETFTEQAMKYADTIYNRHKIYKIITEAYLTNLRSEDSLAYGLKCLEEYGEKTIEYKDENKIFECYEEISNEVKQINIENITKLPLIKNENIKNMLEIMSNVAATGYSNNPVLFEALTVKQVLLSLKYGNAPISPFAYANYGMLLITKLKEYDSGFRFGEIALELSNKINDNFLKLKVSTIVNILVLPWKQNLKKTLVPLKKNADSYMLTGDFEYSGHSAFTYCAHLFYCGENLSDLLTKIEYYINQLEKTVQKTTETILRAMGQMVYNISTGNSKRLDGELFSESIQIIRIKKSNNKNTIFYYNFFKFMNFFYSENYSEAIKAAEICEENINAVTGSMPVTIFMFKVTLLYFKDYSENKEKIINNIQQYKIWSTICPENFEFKYKILLLLYDYFEYGFEKVYLEYEKLIEKYEDTEFLSQLAIFYEVGYLIYRDKLNHLGKLYLKKSIDLYEALGYKTKYLCLVNRYVNNYSVSIQNTNSIDEKYKSDIYDLNNILKVLKIMNSERDIKKLLEKMLILILKNSGSEKCIILTKRDDILYVEAIGTFKDRKYDILIKKALDKYNSNEIPKSIFNQVINKKNNLVLNNIKKEFQDDEYIKKNNIKSLLCMPIFYGGNISGIIYLENSLSENIFLKENIEFLKILATNFGISLENAYSYYEMERLNEQLKNEINKQNIIESKLIVQKEKAEYANAAKSMFLANMSHEIRTPMAGIMGMSEVLEMTDLDENQKYYLEKMKFSANHLMDIINDILDLSKIESGKEKINYERVEFKKHILTLLVGMEILAKQKYIRFMYKIDQNIPKFVLIDKNKFNKILNNIIGNAIKFTEKGEVSIEINLISHIEKNILISIICTDTGVGIPANKLNTVFEPFEQGDSSYSKNFQGTGLGLSITKKMVELMKGNIEIESEENRGTKVIIYLNIEEE